MVEHKYSSEEKNLILREAFRKLRHLGIASPWFDLSEPFTALRSECANLMAQSTFAAGIRSYLKKHTVVRRALTMFFTHISMAARARWDEVPEDIRPITARGWFLGRWLPTFLIVDGPIGRFLNDSASPLAAHTGAKHPNLDCARDFFNHRVFRLLRNGFAHWSFDWEVVGPESYVIAYDWDRDLPTARLHQEEADAFHIIAFAIIEILDGTLLGELEDDQASEVAIVQ